MKNSYLLITFILLISNSFSQNILISNGGTDTVYGGEMFYDAGGPMGSDGNTNHTMTLCPPTSNQSVALDFVDFISSYRDNPFGSPDEDALLILNGNTVGSPNIGRLIGDYTGTFSTSPNPYRVGSNTVNASMPNVLTPTIFSSTASDGCLTLQFDNTSTQLNTGWSANVIVFDNSSIPGCNIDINLDSLIVCNGSSVNLLATGIINNAPLNNDFNNSTVGTGWQATAAATFTSNVCSSTSLDNSVYLWMQNAISPRELRTNSMDVSNGGTLSFEYRQAANNGSASPCESPDRNSSARLEGIYVQYSSDAGTTWNTIKFIFPNGQTGSFGSEYALNGCGDYTKNWTKMTYPIPIAARTANTEFRWIQGIATNSGSDNWGLDNVIISTPLMSTLTITNLTTNIILSTTSNNSLNISVSPTSTTIYRATISDGINSCTEDITVTVNNCSTPCGASQTLIWN